MRFVIAVVAWAVLGGQAQAQERVLGLLSLPEVYGPRACAPFEPGEVALHAAPGDAKAIAFIRVDQNWSFAPHGGCEGLEVSIHRGEQHEDLPTLEYDYEMPAAIVLEHRDDWFKIRLKDKAAWIQASVVDRFMPLSDLFEEFVGVTAINTKFTGRLTSAPGVVNGAILPRVSPSQPVHVIEIRESRGQSWVNVEMMSHSPCAAGNQGPPQVIATGWLPMHDDHGEPTVWFSSRGC